ncbi:MULTISPECIES: tetratricopeptide repeat protein [unclassified Variovorax]|uniref:tetratricopeptide repeat protein n=1 Tax=unclassified Variovorax TaxID=663243 RepID=UPI0011AF5A6A|nr:MULTISPECIES: tetratricopeptide repeat protein [unclassified Variovorax]
MTRRLLLLAPAMALFVLASGCAIDPGAQTQPPAATTQAEDLADFEKAGLLLRQGKPSESLQVLDSLIDRFEARHRERKGRIYSARTRTESLHYMTLAAKDRQNAIDVGPTWGHAQYLKGYALVELERIPEARRAIERAIELAPANAQFRSELGHIYQIDKSWTKALEVFTEAERATEFSLDDEKVRHQTRALRGQGFALIEMGRLDEAEARYRRCLALDANDPVAQMELRLIESLRARGRMTLPGRPTPL